MMRLKVEMLAPNCEGRLSNQVAEVDIVNTMKGPLYKREYDVVAYYRRENGEVYTQKFTVTHDRHDAMWVLISKVVKKIHELEAQQELKRVCDLLDAVRHPEGEE